MPPQGFQEFIDITCQNPKCAKMISFKNCEPEIVNQRSISAVVWAHPDIQLCPYCGAPHQLYLKSVKHFEIVFTLVKTRQQNLISLADPGMKLPPPPGSENSH